MSKIISLFFYIICFLISSILYKIYYQKNKKYLLFFSLLIPILISGFRFNVGTDYFNYINFYYTPLLKNNISFLGRECSFILLVSLATFFKSYKLMFFLSSILTLYFLHLAIKNNDGKYGYLSYFMYLFIFFPNSFNIVRQYIALSIVFYSFKYIFQEKFFKYLFFITVAGTFHISSIIALLLYPFYIFLLKRKKSIILLFYSTLTVLIVYNQKILSILLPKFSLISKYFVYLNAQNSRNLEFFLKLFILLFILILKRRIINKNIKNYFYLNILVLDLLLTFLGFNNPYIKRISIYFNIVQIFLIPNLLNILTSKSKILGKILIIFYSIGLFILNFYILGFSEIFPYSI